MASSVLRLVTWQSLVLAIPGLLVGITSALVERNCHPRTARAGFACLCTHDDAVRFLYRAPLREFLHRPGRRSRETSLRCPPCRHSSKDYWQWRAAMGSPPELRQAGPAPQPEK